MGRSKEGVKGQDDEDDSVNELLMTVWYFSVYDDFCYELSQVML